MSFLKAEWRKLILVNYAVDAALLKPYIPYGTELDLWNGKAYLSLVGFKFVDTKMLGIKIPFHINFPEVNLRFYVKRFEEGEWKRGVVFIKEIVPKPAITFVANTVYKENYATMKMNYSWASGATSQSVEYKWKSKRGWNKVSVEAALKASPIELASEAEYITEHYWGYAYVNDKKSNEYEVTHPRWEQYEIKETILEVDFEDCYGATFAFLNQEKPASVMLAEGSKITVEGKRVIS